MYRTPYVASLRIYEPEVSVSSLKTIQGNVFRTAGDFGDEQSLTLRRVIQDNHFSNYYEGAYKIQQDGKTYLSPWSTQIRTWRAIHELRLIYPSSILSLILSKESLTGYSSFTFENRIPHILSSCWQIPPRWFALFEVKDRSRVISSKGVYCQLRTSIESAKNRLKYTQEVVKQSFGSGTVEAEIRELLDWLEYFDKDSIVECDYGGLASYLDKLLVESGDGGLISDTSIEDVQESIRGLALGEAERAAQAYNRLTSRWSRLSALATAS